MKKSIFIVVSILMISACTSKRQMVYLKGVNKYTETDISKQKTSAKIQVDDVLRIEVRSMIPEAAIVYNRVPQQTNAPQNINLLQLEGYPVSSDYTINFPVLGVLDVTGTTLELEKEIAKKLLEGGISLILPYQYDY